MKYFTKGVKIALTAIAALILLFFGINFLKGVNLFKSTDSYIVKFSDAAGLPVSTPVYANGYPVGLVRKIDYDFAYGKYVLVSIELNKQMRVPSGTEAKIQTDLMGNVKLNLKLGSNPLNNMEPGDTLRGSIDNGVLGDAQQMLPKVAIMMEKVDSILDNLNRITSDPALMQTLHNAAQISNDLKTTTKQVNKLLANDVPQLTGRLNRIGGNLEKVSSRLAGVDVDGTMRKVNATLDNVKALTAHFDEVTTTLNNKMNSQDNSLGLFLNDRSLYDNLNSTAGSADSLLKDLKSRPKRYVHFSVFGRKDK